MYRIALISMPFKSAKLPSMGLSLLKPALEQAGFPCSVYYFNINFRNICSNPASYDLISELPLAGEWAFSPALYGQSWAESSRGGKEPICNYFAEKEGLSSKKDLLKVLFDFRSLSPLFLDRCLNEIARQNYNIIGFSSSYNQQIASLSLARLIKKHFPEKIIAFGGANCAGIMGSALIKHFPFIDWVFNGEAEQSFPEAVKRHQQKKSLKGIGGLIYKDSGIVCEQGCAFIADLDSLPYPDHDDFFNAINNEAPDLKERVRLYAELSRGCSKGEKSQCIFCGLNGESMIYRRKSEHRAFEEIDYLVRKNANKKLYLVDNIFHSTYFKTLLPKLAALRLSSFYVETFPALSNQQLIALKTAGTIFFQPGIESLDPELLHLMNKQTTKLSNLFLLKACRELGLYPQWNLLHSFPGERAPALYRMSNLVPLVTHLRPPDNLNPVQLHRFSPMHENPAKWGITGIKAKSYYRYLYPFEENALKSLSYIFDYDQLLSSPAESQVHKAALEELIKRVRDWQAAWAKKPPVLVKKTNKNGTAIVYDTRPASKRKTLQLNRLQNFILDSCAEKTTLREIFAKYAEIDDQKLPGEDKIKETLVLFRELGYVVKEGDSYLSLVNCLETMTDNRQIISEIDLIYSTF